MIINHNIHKHLLNLRENILNIQQLCFCTQDQYDNFRKEFL